MLQRTGSYVSHSLLRHGADGLEALLTIYIPHVKTNQRTKQNVACQEILEYIFNCVFLDGYLRICFSIAGDNRTQRKLDEDKKEVILDWPETAEC